MTWSTAGQVPNENMAQHHIPQIRLLRPIVRKQKGGFVNPKSTNIFPEITILANDASTPSKAFFTRFIKDQIDFDMSHVRSRFPFDCSQTEPTPRTLTEAPKYIEDTYNPKPGSGFLQFWTVSAEFNIDKPQSKDTIRGPKNSNTRLGIFGSDNREVGIIFVDPVWVEANIQKEHEFILLCEGRDVKGEGGRVDDEPGWKYKVMLIERHDDWAERVAVGSIEKQELSQALATGAVWKEIILG